MSNARHVRREASELLRVSKQAFKFIRDNPSGHDPEREALLNDLREVIDRADPPKVDERLTTIRLQMTNASATAIIKILRERAKSFEVDRVVLEAVSDGLRRTKQRAYVKLELDHRILRRLRYVLLHSKTTHHDEPFKRLAEQIEKEGLNKNPMEILGKMGL